jgi:alpha-L-rhamnosidase
VNFTGTYRMKISGSPGDTITFRLGERIYEDGSLNPMTAVIGQIKRKGVGGPGAPEVAWQTNRYIIGDQPSAWFQPEFTYHVYRYLEITGLDQKPEPSDIKGLFMHSDVDQNNRFSCSSDLLNSIQEATERTFLANLVSVQSDCPAREKFAYGGDLNATCESFMYNFDMQDFYRKTVLRLGGRHERFFLYRHGSVCWHCLLRHQLGICFPDYAVLSVPLLQRHRDHQRMVCIG